MVYSTGVSYKAPVYFHRVRDGEDSFDKIASRYSVDTHRLMEENTGVKPEVGEIVVVSLRDVKHS